ncbi:MAG: hypothetical protein H0V56_00675 [Chthoniobacterales bacterium]|nr:hypothetical protein [Chthoniobacterales bacterium]
MFATSFVLGYHGCERKVGEAILAGREHVTPSRNIHDWLGHGAYFWENSPRRALDWAQFLMKHPPDPARRIRDPFVIGAIIDLGNCLDLTDAGSLEIIRAGYDEFSRTIAQAGAALPKNEPALQGDIDLVKRHLDCAVVNFVHLLREQEHNPFDTVRGIFTEGGELYPGAKIQAKTHVQVCVRDPVVSIKGYFRPPGGV